MTECVAIVTGASQDIARATAGRLARDFSGPVLVAREKNKLETTAADVRSAGAEVMIFDVDLREPQSATTVIKETLGRFGRIDALLNIAGAVPQIDLFEMSDAQWDDGMALKFHSAPLDDARLGRPQSFERISCIYFGQRSLYAQTTVCRSCSD
jgi:3-oxoacyl-[acyl-carrier protein] reductase